MSRYEEILKKHPTVVTQRIPMKSDFTTVYGYANGQFIGEFNNKATAKEAGAKATEKVFDQEGYENAKQAYNQAEENFDTEWKNALRSDHSELSDYVFNVLFAIAWRESHSYGYEAVERTLNDYVEIAFMTAHNFD